MSLPPVTDPDTSTPPGPGTGPTPAPTGGPTSPLGSGLSPGMLAVLRKIVTEPDFRVQFAADPVLAITTAGIPVTSEDMEKLTALTAAQLDQLAQGVIALSNASAAGASGLMARAEGTNTLIYAVLVAVLLAVRAQ